MSLSNGKDEIVQWVRKIFKQCQISKNLSSQWFSYSSIIMGLEIQDDLTFPLLTGAKCLERGAGGKNSKSLNSLRCPALVQQSAEFWWESYSSNRHHCPDVDTLGGFQVGNKDHLEVETFLSSLLWRGALSLQHVTLQARELSPSVSLQPPSPHKALRREAARSVAMVLFLQVWEIDYMTSNTSLPWPNLSAARNFLEPGRCSWSMFVPGAPSIPSEATLLVLTFF